MCRCSALFCAGGVGGGQSGGAEATLWQNCVKKMQHSLRQFEGELVTIMNDDAECIIVVGFGLAPLAHDDDQVRAVTCAMDIIGGWERLNIQGATIGVASGYAFCGVVGNSSHKMYTVQGDCMLEVGPVVLRTPDRAGPAAVGRRIDSRRQRGKSQGGGGRVLPALCCASVGHRGDGRGRGATALHCTWCASYPFEGGGRSRLRPKARV